MSVIRGKRLKGGLFMNLYFDPKVSREHKKAIEIRQSKVDHRRFIDHSNRKQLCLQKSRRIQSVR